MSGRIPRSTLSSWSPWSEDEMIIDPEAVQRALRTRFPAPELAPDASDWMRKIVFAVGSNPFATRERDVLKFVEAPLTKLKTEPQVPAGIRLRGAERDRSQQLVSLQTRAEIRGWLSASGRRGVECRGGRCGWWSWCRNQGYRFRLKQFCRRSMGLPERPRSSQHCIVCAAVSRNITVRPR